MATLDDNITVIRWLDTKAVHTISTYSGTAPVDFTQRYDQKENKNIEISWPFATQEYNNIRIQYMGGVDMMDKIIPHYPHGIKNRK